MVDVEATVDALLVTEQKNPGVAGQEQRGRKRFPKADAAEHEETAAVSLTGVKSETEHIEAIDDNTFPISCFLEKDARNVYTLSGFCRLCDQTFRAAGCVWQGKAHPWNNHARMLDKIVQHARTHGAVGYTIHRNLDEMRLDWARPPDEAADVVADASVSRVRRIKKHCEKCGIYKSIAAFRRTKSKERVDICGSCELLQCAACAAMLSRGKFAARDICRYFDADAKHLTCLVCMKQQQSAARLQERLQRQQRLQERKEQELLQRQQRIQRLQERKEKCKRKARTCAKCGTNQGISAFRLTERKSRVDICGDCELVPCAACTAMLSRKDFAGSDIRSYFKSADTKHITCFVCKEQQQEARQQRLQELMEKNKRRFCTCKHPRAHTRTCLLRVTFA